MLSTIPSPLFQITRSGMLSIGPKEEFDLAKREFEQRHCTVLPSLLEPRLLQTIHLRVKKATFVDRDDDGIASESCMTDDATLGILCFMLNNEALFQFVERLTGCARIGCFLGRVYRFSSNSNHYDSWHDDRADSNRILGLSLNLSSSAYSGGMFEIRTKNLPQPVHATKAIGSNDALLFKLSEQLEHRVTPVVAGERTVLAGWFQSSPDYRLAYRR